MILFRRFVSRIVAAHCVATILILSSPLVFAQQQSNYQAELLYELQAMRQEIAELRDMVERQDYQIRQLQRVEPATPISGQDYSQGNSPMYGANQVPQVNQAPNQGSVQSPVQGPSQGATSNQTYPGSSFPEQTLPNQENFPTATGRTYPGEQQALPVENYPNQQGTVEERVIGDQLPTDNSSYPPVEERTIGNPSSTQTPNYNEPYLTDSEEFVLGQEPANSSPSEFPVPYERTVPSRQPIPNNIPPVNPQPGGVIAIPSEAPAATAQVPTNVPAQNTASVNEQGLYQQGFEMLKQSQHEDAVAIFKQQISSFPSGEYADDAHYWIAESMYVNRELDQSKLYFRSIIDNFPQSLRVPDAMLKTAYIEQEQGNGIEARILLQEIIQYHPRSNAAISAKNRLADIQ